MLLLTGALIAELTYDLFAKPRGLCEHVIQPVEHLFQVL